MTPNIPKNGEDLTINMSVRNLSDDELTVNINSTLYSCLYTGKKYSFVAKDTQSDCQLAADSGKCSKFATKFDFTVHLC